MVLKDCDPPVFFHIPADCQPTSPEPTDKHVVWRLDASANAPGVDYHATFDVPVFRIAAAPIADTAAAYRQESPVMEQPAGSKIRFDRHARGGPRFEFPAARTPGAALGLTGFLLMWCGFLVLMIWKEAPVFFPIVFGLFAVLMFAGVLTMGFLSQQVVVTGEAVEVTSRLLGFRRVRTVAKSEIAAIKVGAGMQSGRTLYYDIHIHRTNGKQVTAGSMIRDKREAEWIVERLCDCLSGRG